jgi:NADH-quinone oxidoreductase subunit J
MTQRPHFVDLGSNLLPGLIAVALFAVLAAVFVVAGFGDPQGFPADANIVESIGYALVNLDPAVPSEGFLVAFVLIAVVLDAALDGSIRLAKRYEDSVIAMPDGGRLFGRGDDDEGGED